MKTTTKPIIYVIFLLLVICFSAYSQQIYRWVDEKGNINYTTRYGRIPQQYRNQVSEPTEKTEQKQLIATEEEVRRFIANYIERYTQKDIDGFLSLFSPQAVQNQRDGLDEIKKIYSDFFDKSKELRYHMEDTRIEIFKSSVKARSLYEVDQILKKRGKKKVWRGEIRWILIRENGTLRIRSLDFKSQKSV
jgi:ketosteroid isomerase-like protein